MNCLCETNLEIMGKGIEGIKKPQWVMRQAAKGHVSWWIVSAQYCKGLC